ncbi:uncharacterized protein LOC126736543 isoform X4 [Anthonomus grandis grandis]|uniref:uncharacterized protein LOC126736543 isoform X4 n=1 Tax=Anthonomus grandis grandis TaxID=2921223 RepID=UPI002165D6CB|nr:uncharacterized protein LOC126736543 isoform X4 [Anthonomus grandis grandis]
MVVLPDKLLVKVMVLSMVATTGFSRVKREEDAQQSYPEGENEIEPLIIDRGPYFDKSVSKNVTALVGKTAYLGCRIRNLGNRTIFKTPVKRAKTKVTPHEMQQQIFMKSCTDALKNCDQESESTAFAKFVATKHRKLNESQQMYAETLITKILHKAALNQLTEDLSTFSLKIEIFFLRPVCYH